MTPEARLVEQVHHLTLAMLTPIDQPHRNTKPIAIDLAFQHIDEWAVLADHNTDSTRGGSSSPTDSDEQAEIQRVARMAVQAREELPASLHAWLLHTQHLVDELRRFTRTVDASRLPKDFGRYCTNCKKAGYLWEPVYDRAPNLGLCRWCWERRGAIADDRQPPPIEAVQLHHQGRHRDAARLLHELHRKHEQRNEAA